MEATAGVAVQSESKPHDTTSTMTRTNTKADKETSKWQRMVLPIMGGVLIVSMIFFFPASYLQLRYLLTSIPNASGIDLGMDALGPVPAAGSFEQYQVARQQEILARMEAFLIERRYHGAELWLMSTIWLRYLGFVTGMILALVGASFILGKLQEASDLDTSGPGGWKLTFKSTSPGLVLALLGAVLMLGVILDRDNQSIKDGSIYLPGQIMATSETTDAPKLDMPDAFLTPEAAPN